jgi:DNA-binding NarL/FixJ family response regulator
MSTTGKTTCCLVDDHEVVRAGTRARLAQVDWIEVVGEAATATDAGRVLRELQPDLALVDVRLPDGDGAALAKELVEAGLSTRFVLYSGNATTAQAEEALESGVAGFVLKDSSLATMVDALTAAQEGRRYIDPTIAAELIAPTGGKPLSPREREILTLMSDGGQNAAIAHELGISVETVKAHVSNILMKLEADGRTHAVAKALRAGLIS